MYSCTNDPDYKELSYHKSVRETRTKLGTVYFEKSSFAVNQPARKELMSVARVLSLYERYNDTQRIRLIGYSDQDGDSMLNLHLGLARAEEVARVLENYGVSMTRAKIGSYGEARTFKSSPDSRKVEIWLENDPWSFLKSQLFIYIVLSIVFSFLTGYLAHRIIKSNSRI